MSAKDAVLHETVRRYTIDAFQRTKGIHANIFNGFVCVEGVQTTSFDQNKSGKTERKTIALHLQPLPQRHICAAVAKDQRWIVRDPINATATLPHIPNLLPLYSNLCGGSLAR